MSATSLLTFTKVSGMLVVTPLTGLPKYYGATAIATAKCSAQGDGQYVNLTIAGDVYTIPYNKVKVGTTTSTTASSALTLLNSILGS